MRENQPKLEREIFLLFTIASWIFLLLMASTNWMLPPWGERIPADRSLLWVMLVIGLSIVGFNFYLASGSRRTRPFVLITVGLFILNVALAGERYLGVQQAQSFLKLIGPVQEYTIDKSISELEVLDLEGRTGRLRFKKDLTITADSVKVLWVRNLASTGELASWQVRFENASIKEQHIEPRAGIYEVRTEFLEPLRRGQKVRKIVELDIVGSEPEPLVSLTQNITRATDYTEMTLHFPAGRPCREARAYSRFITEQREESPRRIDGGLQVKWSKANPELNHKYTVECKW